ncbi:Cell division cycle protein 16 [Nymphon striatum]|nr:Cell division cycle protein 16 [Nymphon striatum]
MKTQYYDLAKLQNKKTRNYFQAKVANKLGILDIINDSNESLNLEQNYEDIEHIIKETAEEELGLKIRRKTQQWYDEECSNATNERKELRKLILQDKDNLPLKELFRQKQKQTKKLFRYKKRKALESLLDKIEEDRLSGNIKEFYKGVGNIKKGFHPRSKMIRSDSGQVLTLESEVIDQWKHYFEELLNRESPISPNAQTAFYKSINYQEVMLGKVNDVYWLAQCLYLTRQYHRASHCILSGKLDLYQSKEYQEALDILDGCKHDNHLLKNESTMNIKETKLASVKEDGTLPFGPEVRGCVNLTESTASLLELQAIVGEFYFSHCSQELAYLIGIDSAVLLLRGHLYEALENRLLAADCFKEALKLDVNCYEAFEALIKHQMLTAQEEQELLASLPFEMKTFEDIEGEACLVKSLYENKLKKYDKPDTLKIAPILKTLPDNLDLEVSMAERHYYNCHYQDCFKSTTRVLNIDQFHSDCLPLHIACLFELKKNNELFYLAHRLVDLYPENAVSWFAVGCYYLLINKNDCARRYLSKATTLDCVFGPAWLAYGHSFAVENEHDQAMAAYFKASQLMRGCHLPLLYIGLEYGLTHNSKLAERFFHQALAIAPEDPSVLHEMGVIAYQNEDWVTAERYLKQAADIVTKVRCCAMPEKWEPVLNNLGHTYRKMKRFDDSLDYHLQSLVLCPQNASTLSAIGYVYSLMGKTYESVDYFHKALSFRRDDMFSMTILGQEIENLMSRISPCEGHIDDVPIYKPSESLNESKNIEESSIDEIETSANVQLMSTVSMEILDDMD